MFDSWGGPDGKDVVENKIVMDSNKSIKAIFISENQPPVAQDDSVETDVGTPVTIKPLTNDSDPEKQSLEIIKVGQPSHGRASIVDGETIKYVPDPAFSGTDTFTYIIADNKNLQTEAIITVTVGSSDNNAPLAEDDNVTTTADQPVVVDVLANDTDVDGDTLTLQSVTAPSNGTAVKNGDGTITYTPDNGYTGSDSFTYTVSDGELTAEATVNVTIGSGNAAPTANDDSITMDEDTTTTIDLLANDTDPEGDPISVYEINDSATMGIVINNNDGTVTFTPYTDYHGNASFAYTIVDSNNNISNSATVTVEILPVNDPPEAYDDNVNAMMNNPLTINVLENDYDAEFETLQVSISTNPVHGSVTVNPDYTITYTPDTDYTGSDQFDYIVSDGNGSDTGTVFIEVVTENAPPVAGDIVETANVYGTIWIDYEYNTSDPDGDSLTLDSFTQPTYGLVYVDEYGDLMYEAPTSPCTDSFTYTVSDPFGETATGTVTVEVSDPYNVKGTLTFPESVSYQEYTVFLDDNLDETDGYVDCFDYFVETATTEAPFRFDNVAPGTYYIYAKSGIYEGVHGQASDGTLPTSPTASVPDTGKVNFNVDMYATKELNVNGTITLPEVATGFYIVFIDTDTDSGNGQEAFIAGEYTNKDQISYSASVTPGTYYVYAMVDLDNNSEYVEAMGYYGVTPPDIPGEPNAVIPESGSVTLDILTDYIMTPASVNAVTK
ncbi:Ig-like domain-containing protein [Halothermothrix orenii]|uniref:Cadherin domain-containing protein n=1 Tax=Halothermothrix orenii (strain H 168 / OCM 544 / DSM 9562) TaxID=373903 RepID=B8CZN3_HALOH|nr:Ig-like domain-containing protein [Halothermothrix orenii]ACL70752.1 hypothetical protein Hore_20050 [Halothermothrix orenii H 168]